jgi:serine/threonine protein kinase
LASHPHSIVCRACQAPNEATADHCFKCGQSLFVVTEGALLAGRYEILKPIGKGGMGMVYKAHDRELDEIVALKVLRADVARSGDMARRFKSEIKIARRIRHRNVCGIHEFGQDGHLQFIAMELIEGVDFRKVLQERGALPVGEAFDVSIQTAKGLQAIHDAGIVHRDLKTPNLMRDAQGVVRLMDFGIAKDVAATGGDQTMTGMIVGTPEYMSPEQARGQRVDNRSDIYALGIVVWELFTGDVPFRGDSPLSTLYKQIQDPLPFDDPRAATLPGSLRPVLEKALAKEPQDRYQTVRDFAEGLRGARAAAGFTGASGKVPIVRPGALGPTEVPVASASAATLPGDFDDDDFDPPPATAAQPLPTVAMAPPTARTVAVRSSRPAPAPAAGPQGPSRARLILPVAGVVAAIALAVLAWKMSRPPEQVAVLPSPIVSPVAPTPRPRPSPVEPSPTLEPPSPSPAAPSPVPTPRPPSPRPTPAPSVKPTPRPTPTQAPSTAPSTTPPPTAPPTPPPTAPPTSGPPAWNSVPAVRQALANYVAAFVSLDPNAIKAVYPGISKSELERIRYFKAYDMEVEPGKIEISGKQAKAEVSLKASIKAFTGKDHVLAPHQETFVLEYKDGAWVRVK